MKRTLIIATIVVAAMGAKAQNIAYESSGGLGVIPGSATISGKSYMFKESYPEKTWDTEAITILDGDFNSISEFNVNIPKVTVAWHQEKAVSALKASDLYAVSDEFNYIYLWKNEATWTSGDTVHTVNTAEDLVNYFNTNLQSDGVKYEIFTDYKGRKGVINTAAPYGYNNNFYDYERFGKVLPRQYFIIDEGNILCITLDYSQDYSKIDSIDASTLTWEPIEGTYDSYDNYGKCVAIEYVDLDKGEGSFEPQSFAISQNLFNEDSKWEYLTTAYDSSIASDDNNYDGTSESNRFYEDWSFNDEGYVVFTRTTYTSKYHAFNCIQLRNEDGDVLFEIGNSAGISKTASMYHFGGKNYIKATISEWSEAYQGWTSYDVLYLIDTSVNAVKEVSRTRLRVDPTIVNKGENVNITFTEDTRNSSISLVDASGKIMGTKKLPNGQENASISTSNLAKGVYSITTTSAGQRPNSQRIIVK